MHGQQNIKICDAKQAKQVRQYNKFCASSWIITKINILRCTVSKTSKLKQSFGKYSNIKFRENPSGGRGVVPCGQTDKRKSGQTDMTKLTV